MAETPVAQRSAASMRIQLKQRIAWAWLLNNNQEVAKQIDEIAYKKYPVRTRRNGEAALELLELLKEVKNG